MKTFKKKSNYIYTLQHSPKVEVVLVHIRILFLLFLRILVKEPGPLCRCSEKFSPKKNAKIRWKHIDRKYLIYYIADTF